MTCISGHNWHKYKVTITSSIEVNFGWGLMHCNREQESLSKTSSPNWRFFLVCFVFNEKCLRSDSFYRRKRDCPPTCAIFFAPCWDRKCSARYWWWISGISIKIYIYIQNSSCRRHPTFISLSFKTPCNITDHFQIEGSVAVERQLTIAQKLELIQFRTGLDSIAVAVRFIGTLNTVPMRYTAVWK